MNDVHESTLHSAEYFGEQRNFWWNHDFISLMGKRWKLKEAKNILDVGCGLGHWGHLMLNQAHESAQLVSIDKELSWVKKAAEIAHTKGISHRAKYSQASVEKLPFPDNIFDIVTCQTVLIHVSDVKKALAEMLRVLKPQGRLCLVEPNNLARSLANSKIVSTERLDIILMKTEFQFLCEKGKMSLNLGHNSIGELIPKYLTELGVNNINIYMSDKCFSYIPPYSSPDQKTHLKQQLEWIARDFWIWNREETKKYFIAGGGTSERFEILWNAISNENAEFVNSIQNNTHVYAGGGITYLFSGEKQ